MPYPKTPSLQGFVSPLKQPIAEHDYNLRLSSWNEVLRELGGAFGRWRGCGLWGRVGGLPRAHRLERGDDPVGNAPTITPPAVRHPWCGAGLAPLPSPWMARSPLTSGGPYSARAGHATQRAVNASCTACGRGWRSSSVRTNRSPSSASSARQKTCTCCSMRRGTPTLAYLDQVVREQGGKTGAGAGAHAHRRPHMGGVPPCDDPKQRSPGPRSRSGRKYREDGRRKGRLEGARYRPRPRPPPRRYCRWAHGAAAKAVELGYGIEPDHWSIGTPRGLGHYRNPEGGMASARQPLR